MIGPGDRRESREDLGASIPLGGNVLDKNRYFLANRRLGHFADSSYCQASLSRSGRISCVDRLCSAWFVPYDEPMLSTTGPDARNPMAGRVGIGTMAGS